MRCRIRKQPSQLITGASLPEATFTRVSGAPSSGYADEWLIDHPKALWILKSKRCKVRKVICHQG
jgi:hypothetical protein